MQVPSVPLRGGSTAGAQGLPDNESREKVSERVDNNIKILTNTGL
jgi:hypothetical protein